MAAKTIAPYGSWASPISADLIASKSIGLSNLSVETDCAYWTELRPSEQGRTVLVRYDAVTERIEDLTPAPFDVGCRINEYGGGGYAVYRGRVVFSDRKTGAVHLIQPDGAIRAVTTAPGLRFGDFIFDAKAERVLCVREDHRAGPQVEAVTTLVSLPLETADHALNTGTVIASGHDFYSSPRLSPDGTTLAWLTWDHPDMPWDATQLWLASIEGDRLAEAACIAGGPTESVAEPSWSPSGMLHFVSDRTDWWNLYRWQDGTAVPILPLAAEFTQPHWVLGRRSYMFLSETALSCLFVEAGDLKLGVIRDGTLERVGAGASSPLLPLGREFIHLAVPPDAPPAIMVGMEKIIRRSTDLALDPGGISPGQPIRFPTRSGGEAYAIWYAPKNAGFEAPEGERPPLLVVSHGGPTAMASNGFALATQFWTSRGFGVLAVNYGGSTGFGRRYRERLYGAWGVVDVEDYVDGARYLIAQGLADPNRVAIRGNSAGGYTTLAALTMTDFFKAGASLYGVADLIALATDTHKFESRYLDRLIGTLPEQEALYRQRSPLEHLDGLACPVIFFQGADDKVVPPNQAQLMVDALDRRKLPVAHYEFAGEAHGFRKAETIRRSAELELSFYGQVFGFEPSGDIERADIRNPP
jgi:acetyl esterase/lipase